MSGTVERFQERNPHAEILHDAEALFTAGAAEAAARADAVKRGAFCAVCERLSTVRCAKCCARRYCGADCQRDDWRAGHRAACVKAAAKASGE